jgi:capsule polysaccharide export protein KpsE/RkpR
MKAPGALIGWVKTLIVGEEVETDGAKVNPFRLTKKQDEIVKSLEKKVVCDVDKKTMVITIDVTDQDPVIAATMADTVKARLQNFITEYRTSKVRVDLAYYKKIYAESKSKYEKARQKYAEFMDANHDIILQTVRQKQTDLENDMQLQYNAYTQVAAQLVAAEAKVQEETPAFTTLQSATVPVKKAGPKRAQMCLIFLFLAFLGTTAYILYKEDDLKQLLGLS